MMCWKLTGDARWLALAATLALLSGISATHADQPAAAEPGAAIYAARCASCHDRPTDRIPPRGYISLLRSPEAVVETLRRGSMQPQAAGLGAGEIDAVAEFITAKKLGAAPAVKVDPAANRCASSAPPLRARGATWNGWGGDHENKRYVAAPGLSVRELPRLKPKWAFALPGSMAWGQAVIVGGRLFTASHGGTIYSLDARSGCTYWAVETNTVVRTTVSVGALPRSSAPARFAVFYGELETGIVHARDAESGALLWSTKVDEHPFVRLTAAPVLHADRLYVPVSSMEEVTAGASGLYPCCSFRGSIVALDTASGRMVWKAHAITDEPRPTKVNSDGTRMFGPAGAAIWSTPTVDAKRGLVYAGTGNSYTEVETEVSDALVAFDMRTGERKWVSQVLKGDNSIVNCGGRVTGNCPNPEGPNLDFGSSPILRTLKNRKPVIVVGNESGIVYAFDAANRGKQLWQHEVGLPPGEGSLLGGQAADEDTVYAASFQRAPVEEVYEEGHVFTPLPRGALTALDLRTGKRRWQIEAPEVSCAWGSEGCSHGQRAAVTAIPGAVFSGALDGHIRAYAARDGAVLWDFDAGQAMESVNGVKAGGGPIAEGGQTIVDGILYVNVSSMSGGAGAIIAFSVDGK
ncbi:MAG: PQQ-binding-like beta-propeller repeat protein [Gammaproteobacteria bacterium]|nr:PQQ-binding-like beta-propeller repeat protein [Gammaproteobacteria bacterium]